ncbi:MAG TPA: four helix bundle protein [Candidatus Saccharibacteria bacterium]|nr:four helix bundle protein [Candidatus Saccharibacteria bacterium]
MADNIKSFEDLTVWQESQSFAVEVYKATKQFPKDEIFAMTSQLRRAVSSVSANIAEGFGRASVNDKLHFYTMAYGSLLEVKNFLYLAEKLDYIDKSELDKLIIHSVSCQKLINAFKAGLR